MVRKKSLSNMNRQKIADFIDRQSPTDRIGAAYDRFMVLAILVSLLPLMFMKSHEAFWFTELGSALVFIIDYLLRWGTADMRNNNRLLRQTRVLKMFGISSKMRLFMSILYKERQVLSSVLVLALLYIFVTTLILFNVEPHINPYTGQPTFRSFFDALYWATVTLTTVDYGDMCPVTDIGRFVSMLSSLFGIAVIALPSGVITAHYLDELRKEKAC